MEKSFELLVFTSGVLVSSLFTLIISFVFYRLKRNSDLYQQKIESMIKENQYEIKHNKMEMENMISPLRERIENMVYSKNAPLVKDPGFFVDANHILFDSSTNKEVRIHSQLPDFSFFEDMNINLSKIDVKKEQVACLMPFNKRFDNIKETIFQACNDAGYVCKRSDNELLANNNDIRRYIIKLILESNFVIAVLDGRNPNVFYEIGIAQSMGKLVLMVANLETDEFNSSDGKTIFDVLQNRLITYNNINQLKEKLNKTLIAIKYNTDFISQK